MDTGAYKLLQEACHCQDGKDYHSFDPISLSVGLDLLTQTQAPALCILRTIPMAGKVSF